MSETTPQATSPPSPSSSSALSSPPLSSPSAAGPDVGSAQVRSPDPSKKSRISSSSSSPSSRSRNETGDDQSISETCQGKKPLSSSSSPPLHHGGVSTRKPSPSSPPVSTATTPPPPPPSVTPIAWDSQEVRRYEGEVLTVLHTFDRAKEWADLNNCLQKLLRVFSHPAAAVSSSYAPFSTLGTPPFFPFVPHKAVVAKRLAQCLNPLLPSGVHTRALETYAAIFERIGPDGLSKDLATYSAGLLPFFQDGATHVKPLFLDLINAYYLPL
ncbi:n-terminal domain-containing protein, partial [Cystoisospora suis]